MAMRGVYREITPPERFGLHRVVGGDWPETINTLIPLRGGWQDDDLADGSLPVEGSSRRRAQDGDEGRRV